MTSSECSPSLLGRPSLIGEHVGEVGGDLQLDDRRHSRSGGVAQLDLFVPHRSELPPAHDEDPRDPSGVGPSIGPTKVHPLASARLTASGSTVTPPTSNLRLAEHPHVGEEDTVRRVGAEVT